MVPVSIRLCELHSRQGGATCAEKSRDTLIVVVITSLKLKSFFRVGYGWIVGLGPALLCIERDIEIDSLWVRWLTKATKCVRLRSCCVEPTVDWCRHDARYSACYCLFLFLSIVE